MTFILFILGAIILISAFLHFDKILELQYQFYPESWKKDGKASGFSRFLPMKKLFRQSISKRSLNIMDFRK